MTRTSRAALGAVALVALSGCVSFEAGAVGGDVARALEAEHGARVEREFAVAMGGGAIGTGRFLGRLVAPVTSEPARRMARHVRHVKMAVYNVQGALDLAGLARPAALDRYRERDGWYTLATVRDSSGAVWVMYREDGDQLRDVLAVVVSPEDVVVTKLSGTLSEMVADAVAAYSTSADFDDLLSLPGRAPAAADDADSDP